MNDQRPHFGNLARMQKKESAGKRKPGYVKAALELGQLDEKTGIVTFTHQAWLKLRQSYRFPRVARKAGTPRRGAQVQGFTKPGMGIGDKIHSLAGPIGRAINWPCMKGDGTTDLKPGSPCARVRDKLNQW